MDLELLKNKLLANVKKAIEDLTVEILDTSKIVSDNKEKIVKQTNTLDELNKAKKEIEEESKTILKNVNDRKSELLKIEDAHKSKVENAATDYNKLVSASIEVKTELDRLESKKIEMEKVLKEISREQLVFTTLESSIADAKKELTAINDSIKQAEQNFKQQEKEQKARLDKLVKDIEEKKKSVLPTIQELDLRKKQLDTKEKDLVTVENRLKKLFKEQGGSFRV